MYQIVRGFAITEPTSQDANPGFNPGFTPSFYITNAGVNPKIIKYKDVSSESGLGVGEQFSLVWLVCTNHGAYIFIKKI
jgi:hypothetical protein